MHRNATTTPKGRISERLLFHLPVHIYGSVDSCIPTTLQCTDVDRRGGNTTLVTLVIELLLVMNTFHPNDYFEHVMTTLIQVMTIFVKFYVML